MNEYGQKKQRWSVQWLARVSTPCSFCHWIMDRKPIQHSGKNTSPTSTAVNQSEFGIKSGPSEWQPSRSHPFKPYGEEHQLNQCFCQYKNSSIQYSIVQVILLYDKRFARTQQKIVGNENQIAVVLTRGLANSSWAQNRQRA